MNDEDRMKQLIEKASKSGSSSGKILNFDAIGGYKEGLFYVPKTGNAINLVDHIKYRITTDKHPQKFKEGETDHVLDLMVHRGVGSDGRGAFVCLKSLLGVECPICQLIEEELKDQNMPQSSKDRLSRQKAKRRCWYPIIDISVPESQRKIQIFEESAFLYENELIKKAQRSRNGIPIFWDLQNGKTVEFFADLQKSEKGKYNKYTIDAFTDRKPYKDSILDEVPPLDKMYYIPTEAEMRNAFYGLTDVEEVTEDTHKQEPEPEESPRRRRREWDDDVKEEQQEDTQCPEGLRFGIDCDEKPACRRCPQEIWDKCAEIKDGKR